MLDLKISLGDSIETLKPWTSQPFIIDGPYFKGAIDVRIKGLNSDSYFEKTNDLFCIHIHGRFLEDNNADDDDETTVDDIIFGNQFEAPLNLPTGFFMLTKFAQWWDPGLDMHLEDQHPYAFSPLAVTLNTLSVTTSDDIRATCEPSVEISESFEDNTALWFPGSTKPLSSKQRQHYFNDVSNRQKVKVRPDQIWMGDFNNGYMDMMCQPSGSMENTSDSHHNTATDPQPSSTSVIPKNNINTYDNDTPLDDSEPKKKRTTPKRRKVSHGRPCQRCLKRSIGHLCHDEPKTTLGVQNNSGPSNQSEEKIPNSNSNTTGGNNYGLSSEYLKTGVLGSNSNLSGLPLQFFGQMGTGQLTFASEQMGNEISVISDFLDSLGGDGNLKYGNDQHQSSDTNNNNISTNAHTVNTTERFFLTAADPSDGKLEDRLTEVINAKYEAGFLKPYNFVNGYARLQKYMDTNMSASSRQRILNVMGTFRPAFRSVAQSLTDIDLILVEEAFERLLLDYDRVFSSMGVPACLWRRTGEIYKGNKGFAALVNVPMETLREGRLCIYELMAEESAVNYWEKYGNIAFDPGQKAVLTSCLLKSSDPDNTSVISCCFSFTIRRDKYNIPTVIAGNFLPVQLQ
ncbi:hypothetical protein [Absidia glauca]|uniref:Zn(2)-C6 fungal-type domain-containing protein n=1 Tax=Absidia glauca TaxID=4829 RepID=A0A163K9B7_ABSGL|nr:hypothetical protein [Absidia glauca]